MSSKQGGASVRQRRASRVESSAGGEQRFAKDSSEEEEVVELAHSHRGVAEQRAALYSMGGAFA